MSSSNSNHPMPKRWVKCDVEEEYLKDTRKESKAARKMAKAKDRSKFKKTDRDKGVKSEELIKSQKLAKKDLHRGRVLSITPQGFLVEEDGQTFACSLRGVLKKEKGQLKNLVTVGDFVLFEIQPGAEGFIVQVEPRKTILSRADNLSRRKEQLIAANIDQVLITTSVVSPLLKSALVDRYIIAAQRGGMIPIIVINKIDMLDDPSVDPVIAEQERELYREFLRAYAVAGIAVISVSVVTGAGLDQLRDIMRDKASVFSGQSGVGKSSLINAITGLNLRVGKIVDKTQKGAHTTTTAHLLPLEFGGWCIDTPGIKSFGVWDLKAEDIEDYFDEIHATGLRCKFSGCHHVQEVGCAVHKAVEQGKISPLRYQSYLFLMDSVKSEHLRR